MKFKPNLSEIQIRSAIIEAIRNPPKDMAEPEDLFADILREEMNMELCGNKEGIIELL